MPLPWAVNKERTETAGHFPNLGSELWVSFSASLMFAWWQEEHQAIKICANYTKGSLHNRLTGGRRESRETGQAIFIWKANQPSHMSICGSWQPQLRTGRFGCRKVIFFACLADSCIWKTAIKMLSPSRNKHITLSTAVSSNQTTDIRWQNTLTKAPWNYMATSLAWHYAARKTTDPLNLDQWHFHGKLG